MPSHDLLLETTRGRLRIIDLAGHPLRQAARIVGHGRWEQIQLAPDRRHAFVSLYEPRRLYELDLATGSSHFIARAYSPTLSPDHTKLAYLTVDLMGRTLSLVLRNLRSGTQRSIPFVPPVLPGTPPEWVMNWSPDGSEIALIAEGKTVVIDLETATAIGAQTIHPGLAPAFVDQGTLVVLADCCVGPQQLVTLDLASGSTAPFARLSSPTEYIKRIGPGRFLVLDALRELLVVEKGRSRAIATGLSAVSI